MGENGREKDGGEEVVDEERARDQVRGGGGGGRGERVESYDAPVNEGWFCFFLEGAIYGEGGGDGIGLF